MKLLNATEAVKYLQIPQEVFDRYDSKSLILYTLVKLERRYSTIVLDRFKREVLDKRNAKSN